MSANGTAPEKHEKVRKRNGEQVRDVNCRKKSWKIMGSRDVSSPMANVDKISISAYGTIGGLDLTQSALCGTF